MDAPDGSLALDSGQAHDVAEWEAAAAAVLRRAGRLADDDPDTEVWGRLSRTTLDGIAVTPLGTPALLDDLATSGRPTRVGDWDVRTHLRVTEDDDLKAANAALLADLEGGATSLWIHLDGHGTDLGTVLDGVLLDVAPVVLDEPSSERDMAAFVDLVTRSATPAPGTSIGAPPLALGAASRLALDAGILATAIDGSVVHDEGASDVQELGYTLAVGATLLRELTDDGFSLDEALGLVEFRYAVTDDQFASIAKLRAARRLWARLVELCGSHLRVQRQHAVTSRPMMSRYDPWVNLLRTTVAAFSAGVGGADAVTVLPFDSPLGRPDAFGRRLARNTSALLTDEAHLGAVTDPAGGSFLVEKLTDDLAHAAWDELSRIEAAGGIRAVLANGWFDARIEKTVAARERQIATRERPLTGLTEFPNLYEALPEREPDPNDARTRRYGASFEALRDEPAEQKVFLATMGTVASYTARATFASNLFAAGGVDVVPAGPSDGVEQVLTAYDGQPVVCLAGHDRIYGEWGSDLVAALREAGATWVIVAGKLGDLGVDEACAVGVDALAFLTTTREKLT